MHEYDFTLIIAADLDEDATLTAVYEAGCDDATVGQIDGIGYADFIREAHTFGEAVRSAIEQVESVPGLQVVRIEPDDLVTMSEIAHRLGRSRESVRLLIAGARGSGGFPPRSSHLKARSRLWRWSEVAVWARHHDVEVQPIDAALVAALNAALLLRETSEQLTRFERELVSSLV